MTLYDYRNWPSARFSFGWACRCMLPAYPVGQLILLPKQSANNNTSAEFDVRWELKFDHVNKVVTATCYHDPRKVERTVREDAAREFAEKWLWRERSYRFVFAN